MNRPRRGWVGSSHRNSGALRTENTDIHAGAAGLRVTFARLLPRGSGWSCWPTAAPEAQEPPTSPLLIYDLPLSFFLQVWENAKLLSQAWCGCLTWVHISSVCACRRASWCSRAGGNQPVLGGAGGGPQSPGVELPRLNNTYRRLQFLHVELFIRPFLFPAGPPSIFLFFFCF